MEKEKRIIIQVTVEEETRKRLKKLAIDRGVSANKLLQDMINRELAAA